MRKTSLQSLTRSQINANLRRIQRNKNRVHYAALYGGAGIAVFFAPALVPALAPYVFGCVLLSLIIFALGLYLWYFSEQEYPLLAEIARRGTLVHQERPTVETPSIERSYLERTEVYAE